MKMSLAKDWRIADNDAVAGSKRERLVGDLLGGGEGVGRLKKKVLPAQKSDKFRS
jgi:hypothetical protein